MKSYLFFGIAFLSLQTSLFGALPPLWKDVAELKAILEDQQLGNFLNSGEAILEIKKNSKGWNILTNHGKLRIKVNYEKQQMPGKGNFTLEFKSRSN